MLTESEDRFLIRRDADVILARGKAEKVASGIGLDKTAVAEVAIAVTELATNLIKHRAVDGELIVRRVSMEQQQGIELMSSDTGPGIADIDQALMDGYSTRGSLGGGLPAINRLMDEFEIRSNKGEGTCVTARKWVQEKSPQSPFPRFRLSVLSRPFPGLKHNGDAYFVKRYDSTVIFSAIDGLEHGPEAQEASLLAVECLQNFYRRPFEEIFRLCHKRLKGSRGAAMALCRINFRNMTMTHAGVGNVTTRIYAREPTPNPFFVNGTVGVTIPDIRVEEYPFDEGSTLVMFTDGISGRFTPTEFPDFFTLSPQVLARALLDKLGRANDDATIIVGR